MSVLADDSADSCPVFSGKSLEHTVVVQSTDFCVVLVQDFQIIQVQQAGAPDRFPNLFVSILFVIFNLEGIVGEQSFYPLIMGNIEQDFSIVYPSGSPGFGLFVVFAFGDCFCCVRLWRL